MSNVRVRECKYGLMCYFPHDIYIGASLDAYGEYSEGEVEMFSKLLKPGMCVVEVGSNIGAHTVPLARIVGEGGRVYAFEPQRIIYNMLCANIALNGLFNIHAERIALGKPTPEGRLTMGVPAIDYGQPGNFGGVELIDPTLDTELAPVRLLDSFDVWPNFLKLDVEGMELVVLQGAERTIKACRPVIYCENDRDDKSPALVEHLLGLDYDLYWHLAKMLNPDNFRKNADNIWQKPGAPPWEFVSANMLCIPAELKMNVVGLTRVTSPQDKAY